MRETMIGPGNPGRAVATRLLADGHAVVVVVVAIEAGDTAIAERAGDVLAAHGGRFVGHYGRWLSRSIAP